MNLDRFSNILGDEYNIFKEAVPHHEEFQNKVGETISVYSKSLSSRSILAVEGGTGTGLTTTRVLEADSRIKVVGIDNEEKTFNKAKILLKEYKGRIEFRKEDLLEALKRIQENTIDIFVSVYTIHNLKPAYRNNVFDEVTRILKKGGLFVNGDKFAKDNEDENNRDLEEQINAFGKYSEFGRDDLRAEWSDHYKEDEKFKISEKEQINILKVMNFRDIEVVYRKRMEAVIKAIKN